MQIVSVSPLIRLARWTALGAGIFYGAYKYRVICEYHADIRAWEHEQDIQACEDKHKSGSNKHH